MPPQTGSHDAGPAAATQQLPTAPRPPRVGGTDWYRRRGVQIVGAGVLGLVIGLAGGGGDDVSSDLAAAEAAAEDADARAGDAEGEARAALEAEFAQRQADLDARSAELDQREASISERLVQVEAGTIPGDGMFLVGEQVQPGRYQSEGGSPCYWARLDASGEIIDNSLSSGPSIVNVQPGDVALETTRCAPFVKVG